MTRGSDARPTRRRLAARGFWPRDFIVELTASTIIIRPVGSRRGGVAEVTTTPGLVYQREILARIEAQREAKRAARKARKRPSTRTRRR